MVVAGRSKAQFIEAATLAGGAASSCLTRDAAPAALEVHQLGAICAN
jgi:hypothetical protein